MQSSGSKSKWQISLPRLPHTCNCQVSLYLLPVLVLLLVVARGLLLLAQRQGQGQGPFLEGYPFSNRDSRGSYTPAKCHLLV